MSVLIQVVFVRMGDVRTSWEGLSASVNEGTNPTQEEQLVLVIFNYLYLINNP